MNDYHFNQLIEQANESFSGWDFSFITETGRMRSELLSWSYGSMAISLIQDAKSMLDMGTGGGEFLSKLRPFPALVHRFVLLAKSNLDGIGGFVSLKPPIKY